MNFINSSKNRLLDSVGAMKLPYTTLREFGNSRPAFMMLSMRRKQLELW
jgi:hypothetical protein